MPLLAGLVNSKTYFRIQGSEWATVVDINEIVIWTKFDEFVNELQAKVKQSTTPTGHREPMNHSPDTVKLVAQAMRDARLRPRYSEAILTTLLAQPLSQEDMENAEAALTALAQAGMLASSESEARVERAEAALDRIADWHGYCVGRQTGDALSEETITSIEDWLKNIATPGHPANLAVEGSDVRANALREAAAYVKTETEKLRLQAAGYNGSHAAYMLDEDADLLAGIETGILSLVDQPAAAPLPETKRMMP